MLHAINAGLGLERSEADALVTKMVERYSYLFPEDKQPEPGTLFMFIRKEVRHLIRPFDYERLTISDEIIPPDKDEREFIKRIQKLARSIKTEFISKDRATRPFLRVSCRRRSVGCSVFSCPVSSANIFYLLNKNILSKVKSQKSK